MAGIGAYKQIMIVKKVPVKGSEGHWVADTETRYPVYAEIVKRSHDRTYTNGQVQLGNTVQFRVRFSLAFVPNADYKIIYSGRVHTIHSIEKDKEKRFYWIINAESSADE